MTLREILSSIDSFSNDLIIYARKDTEWDLDAEAVLVPMEELELSTGDDEDMTYFLEVEIAKEAIDVWRSWRQGKEPGLSERVEAILYYAENDAYTP